MRAVIQDEYGTHEVLRVAEVESGHASGKVVVEVVPAADNEEASK